MLGICTPTLQNEHRTKSLGIGRDREGDKYSPGDFTTLGVVHEPPGGLEFCPVDSRLHGEPKQGEVEEESVEQKIRFSYTSYTSLLEESSTTVEPR